MAAVVVAAEGAERRLAKIKGGGGDRTPPREEMKVALCLCLLAWRKGTTVCTVLRRGGVVNQYSFF